MRINAFSIANFRSIRKLNLNQIDNVNVFFGENNVGKSNILHGLHLAFYLLKHNQIFLPDTTFHNRNIYKPIEIEMDLQLDLDESQILNFSKRLDKVVEEIVEVMPQTDDLIPDLEQDITQFMTTSKHLTPQNLFHLKVLCDYDEETSHVQISFVNPSGIDINYSDYKKLAHRINMRIAKYFENSAQNRIAQIQSELSGLGLNIEDYKFMEIFGYRHELREHELKNKLRRLRDYISQRRVYSTREEIRRAISELEHILSQSDDRKTLAPIEKMFNLVKSYYDSVAGNFIFIPNKEYFRKEPLTEKDDMHIEIFDFELFKSRLASLIDSPGKKDRKLLENFNRVFSDSYGNIGELEIRRFREQVFAIFDTGYTALPIENQGLGVQDVYLYLVHMILFDRAIVAIEEPEGGLSITNQRKMCGIIEDVYASGEKQLFISSHSEEFESRSSYIVETDDGGTKVISRTKEENAYETRIDDILIRRKLAEETAKYEAMLLDIAEREMTLNILKHIEGLDDREHLDPKIIAGKLGYDMSKVKDILVKLLKDK